MQRLKLLIFVLLYFFCNDLTAQPNTTSKDVSKGTMFYFSVGTNRSFYSKGNISFKSSQAPAFDFTLHKVRGRDDQGFNFSNSAPQYSYALGYYSNKKKWGIEFNFDHIKYYMRQYQQVRLQGNINDHFYNTDTLITPGFVQLEHSDGGNYALLKWVKWKPLVQDKTQRKILHLVLKGGAGPVIPKTNSTIMGKHRDDAYKVSGYVLALEAGLRYSFSKLLFAEAGAKGAYANYSRFSIAGGTGSQHWAGLHLSFLVGLQLAK